MSLKIVVLAKQVPDTRNVGKDAMKADGTINRAALPAIFNPEDLNALEQALRIKDAHPGSTVTLLTMGPARAADIIREGLFRGADGGYLLTDRAFAGADTLATSYALATAIRKIKDFDLIVGGRQAVDQRRKLHAGADIERPDPFRAAELVGGKTQEIAIQFMHVHRNLTGCLRRVEVEQRPGGVNPPRQFGNAGEQFAGFVAGEIEGDQPCAVLQDFRQFRRIGQPGAERPGRE